MNLSKFFIDRPIFAGVLSVLIFVAGLLALRALPISEYPEVVPPSVVVRAQYPGANPKVIAETVATPLEEAINGVEGMLYMGSQATTDGLMTLTVTFKLGTDPDKAQQLVQNRVSQAEPRLPEEVRRLGITTVKSSPDLTMVVHLLSPNDRYDMTYLRNYARAQRQGPARAHRRASARCSCSAPATIRCASGSTRRRSPSAACRPATSCARSARRTCRPRPAWSAPRRALPGVDLQLSINAQGRLQNEEEFGDIIVKTGPNGEVTRLRDIARHRARRRRVRAALAARQQAGGRDRHLPGARLERARDLRQRARGDGRAEGEHARRRRVRDRLRPDAVRARLDRGGGRTRCSKRSRWSCSS